MVTKKLNRLVCFDGFSVSLQGSETNYASPRKDNAIAYSAIEAGFPSHAEELLEPYQEDSELPMGDSVFGWVPMQVIYDIVIKHGGWKEGEIPPMTGLTQEILSHTMMNLAERPYKEATWKHQMQGHKKGATDKERRSVPGIPLPAIKEYLAMAELEDGELSQAHLEVPKGLQRVLFKGLPVPATWGSRRRGLPHYIQSLLNYPYLSPPLYPLEPLEVDEAIEGDGYVRDYRKF